MAKKKILAGNWKMHKTVGESAQFIEALLPKVKGANCSVWIAPPFTSIATCAEIAKGSSVAIGAQNMSELEEGARTGEISAKMLQDIGASFVILGHSERRTYFGETNESIRKKLERAFSDKIRPILCVGETENEMEKGKTGEVLTTQIAGCLKGFAPSHLEDLVIAYEPVWAIGTGKSATAEIAQEAHQILRKKLTELFGETLAKTLPLLYGGSVKPSNVNELLSQPDIDGALIGGASLKVDSFSEMIALVTNL